MLVWQDHLRNEWSVSLQRALAGADLPVAALGTPNPFSLADPTTTEQILESADFGDVAFTDVHVPIYYGPDVTAALEWLGGFRCISDVLSRLDSDSNARALERLRRRSPRTRVETESGSTPVPGSSSPAVPDYSGDNTRVIMHIRAYAIERKAARRSPSSTRGRSAVATSW